MSHYDTGPGDWPASSIPPHERVTDEELAGALDGLDDYVESALESLAVTAREGLNEEGR